ncbi:MAG TPA: hypothetical protein VF545_04390 [Thermoleophilaceae bacterium]|jgi:hypothetical protein
MATRLSRRERALLRAARKGVVDRRAGDPALDAVAKSAQWGGKRRMRAELLAELLTGARGPTPRAVVMRGVRIEGALNLEAVTVACPLFLRGCVFDSPINLIRAELPDLELVDCKIEALVADQVEVAGNVVLDNSVAGVVSLVAAHVAGQLSLNEVELGGAPWPVDLADATLSPVEEVSTSRQRNDIALMGDQLRADKGVYCRGGFVAHGSVRFPGATVGGPLDLDSAKLDGKLMLNRARVQGSLSLKSATLNAGLDGELLEVDQGVSATGLAAHAPVHLPGATVTGTLDIDGASLDGTLDLAAAHVIGTLTMQSAVLRSAIDVALDGELSTIDRDVYGPHLIAGGDVSFAGATIAGGLTLDHAGLNGSLVAAGATIGGNLSLDAARLSGPAPTHPGSSTLPSDTALDLHEAKVGLALTLRPAEAPQGAIDLSHLEVGRLADSPTAWTASTRLRGFAYDDLEADPPATPRTEWLAKLLRTPSSVIDAQARVDWLKRDSKSGGQPFERLGAFYRAAGEARAARHVGVKAESRRRQEMHPAGKVWSRFLYLAVGNGYRSWQALVWIVGLAVVGSVILSGEHDKHHFTPAKTGHRPSFDSLLYSLDSLIPVVNLQQRDAFIPHHTAQTWFIFATLAGWALTTALVAAVTGALRRQ